jgi:hypothetical protein
MTPSRHQRTVSHNDLITSSTIILLVLKIVMGSHIISLHDQCKDRRFINSLNTTFMQFTKEVVNQEYAVEGEFKGLHCCAKGYRSIEW